MTDSNFENIDVETLAENLSARFSMHMTLNAIGQMLWD